MNRVIVILTVGVILSAFLSIRARERELRTQLYVFKPMTVVFILLVAVIVGRLHFSPYFCWILTGLIFCLIGDVFLMFPEKRFIHGLVSFLMAHVFYLLAFTSEVGFGFSFWLLLPFFVYGCLMYGLLIPHLGRMRLSVLVYVIVIVVMVWQAWERWYRIQQSVAFLASMGAVLFIISDSVLAWNRFRSKAKNAQTVILSTYYAAQWLIALSVGQ